MANEKYKILIVDDDAFLLDIYATKFNELGHEAFIAHGAEEALEIIREHKDVDVLLLDIVMPNMDGLTLLKKIKDEKLLPNTAVIILSNQGQDNDIQKAQDLGVDGYIVKASNIPSDVLKIVIETAEKRHS